MEFFREAPLGAIVLVVIGTILAFVVSTPMQIRAARRKAAREQSEKQTGVPELIRADVRGALIARVVSLGGYALMALGFAIWILDL